MFYSNVPYPLRLCVELMHYCVISSDRTAHMTPDELKRHVSVFFSEKEMAESVLILTGNKSADN